MIWLINLENLCLESKRNCVVVLPLFDVRLVSSTVLKVKGVKDCVLFILMLGWPSCGTKATERPWTA
jgi:hypothetical protein